MTDLYQVDYLVLTVKMQTFEFFTSGVFRAMDYLRCGVFGLSSAEESLVATLFRLHGVEPSFIWTLAAAPPYDALLVDSACSSKQFAHLVGPRTKVMRLGVVGGGEESAEMGRPIRSDRLVRWLNKIEVEILHSTRDPFASTSLESENLPPWQSSLSRRLRISSRSAEGVSPHPAFELPPGARIKLRRWPGAALLVGDVNRIRMATMLSRRALSVRDLSHATGLSVDRCVEFIQTLYHTDLLEISLLAVAQPKAVAPTLDVSVAPSAPRSLGIGRSLLLSMRKRFGI